MSIRDANHPRTISARRLNGRQTTSVRQRLRSASIHRPVLRTGRNAVSQQMCRCILGNKERLITQSRTRTDAPAGQCKPNSSAIPPDRESANSTGTARGILRIFPRVTVADGSSLSVRDGLRVLLRKCESNQKSRSHLGKLLSVPNT